MWTDLRHQAEQPGMASIRKRTNSPADDPDSDITENRDFEERLSSRLTPRFMGRTSNVPRIESPVLVLFLSLHNRRL